MEKLDCAKDTENGDGKATVLKTQNEDGKARLC